MEILKIEETKNSPYICLDNTKGKLTFQGESRPEDVRKFYKPILEWLDEYDNYVYFMKDQSANKIKLSCDFSFDYFNSSSAKFIMDILLKIKEIKEKNDINLEVNWIYDKRDEDMLENGEELEEMIGVDFNFTAL